jgi:GNAT superfamily N-acetyltransferase
VYQHDWKGTSWYLASEKSRGLFLRAPEDERKYIEDDMRNWPALHKQERLRAKKNMTTPGYSIHLARDEDIPRLSAIELAAAQLFTGHVPESVPAEVTHVSRFTDAARGGRLWVASMGDMPVGFALVEMLADDLPHLEELDVDPLHGRRGLGTALVRTVCEWAALSGYAMLTLTTFRAVRWNFPFYARLGFVEIAAGTLRPELAAVVSEEAGRGLDPAIRVVMGYRCL